MDENTGPARAYPHVGVIGAGAWGTALALACAQAGRQVTIWAREAEVVDTIRARHENAQFLPGVPLPETIAATFAVEEVAAADAILLATPAQHLRQTLVALARHLPPARPLVICAKGIERRSGQLVTEVLSECALDVEPAILSGPSFARDVALGLPTAVTVAARLPIARRLQATLGHAAFRPYASEDLTGVALGGASKNVYAIACGAVTGLGLGESARAALLARGFAELCRLGRALGANEDTLMGLSGLGDLVLSATSTGSRNFAFGVSLGRGTSPGELFVAERPLAEGIDTAPALVLRARRHAIELPVAETIANILAGRLALEDALPRLMARPFKAE